MLERLAFRLFRWVTASSRRFEFALRTAKRFREGAVRAGLLRRWTDGREAPRIATRSFRDMWRDR